MKIALGVFFSLLLLVCVGWGTSWFGLWAQRPMDMYVKETERQVYQNSVAHQQGANNSIAQDCANMEGSVGADAKAFARFVIVDAGAYSGNRGLSSNSEKCVQEAHNVIQGN